MCNILALMWYWPWNASKAGSWPLNRRRTRLACPPGWGSSPSRARTRASVARFVAPHVFSAGYSLILGAACELHGLSCGGGCQFPGSPLEVYGHRVDARLVLVVEQVVVGQPGDVQGKVEHVGLEAPGQVHSHSRSAY